MDDLGRLVTIQDIKALKARYFRAVDLKDRKLMETLFTNDATADFRGAVTDPSTGKSPLPSTDAEVLVGADAVVNGIMTAIADLVTVHRACNEEIEITSDNTATGTWPMTDMLKLPDGAPVGEIIGYGFYHETYRREKSGWKIESLRVSRLRVVFIAAG